MAKAVKTESEAPALPAVQTPMDLIAQATATGADPDKLEKLMALQERWESSRAAERFADALAAFQAECPPIHKGRRADRFSFAGLDDIMQTIRPLLAKHGLTVTFTADLLADQLHAVCRVRCGSHVEASDVTLPVPTEMRVNATQKMGAAMSYAKRYALCNALNIVVTDEDVDAANLSAQTVTDEQAAELQTWAESLGVAEKVLAWQQVEAFADLPATAYNAVKAQLTRKQGEQA